MSISYLFFTYVRSTRLGHPGGVSVGNMGCPAPQQKKSRLEHLEDEVEKLEKDLEHNERLCDEEVREGVSEGLELVIERIERENENADEDDKLQGNLDEIEDLLEDYVLDNGDEDRCVDNLNRAIGITGSVSNSLDSDLLAKQISNSYVLRMLQVALGPQAYALSSKVMTQMMNV